MIENIQIRSNANLTLIFQKKYCTRVSFEVAMTQLGGHALYIDWRTTNFALSDLSDEINYLSRNVDGIMARLLHNADLQTMMKASRVPVNGAMINIIQLAIRPNHHEERKGTLKGTKLLYWHS